MSPELTKDEVKAATKEAIKEWLDEQAARLGYWFLGLIAVGALILILKANGWTLIKQPLQ